VRMPADLTTSLRPHPFPIRFPSEFDWSTWVRGIARVGTAAARGEQLTRTVTKASGPATTTPEYGGPPGAGGSIRSIMVFGGYIRSRNKLSRDSKARLIRVQRFAVRTLQEESHDKREEATVTAGAGIPNQSCFPSSHGLCLRLVHGLHPRRWAPGGRKVCATDHRTVRASRRLRGSRGYKGRMALEPRCRHPASAEPMAHGRDRKPCRRDGRLHPHEPAERPDPARSPMATPTASLGIEAAYQGAAGGLDTRRMEAVRRGHGTRLPTRKGTAKPSKAVGSRTAGLR